VAAAHFQISPLLRHSIGDAGNVAFYAVDQRLIRHRAMARIPEM